jgi:hypothetical protein
LTATFKSSVATNDFVPSNRATLLLLRSSAESYRWKPAKCKSNGMKKQGGGAKPPALPWALPA